MLPPNPNAYSLQEYPNVEGMFGDGMMDVFRTLQSLGLFDADCPPGSCGVFSDSRLVAWPSTHQGGGGQGTAGEVITEDAGPDGPRLLPHLIYCGITTG